MRELEPRLDAGSDAAASDSGADAAPVEIPDRAETICAEDWVLFCENFENRALGPVAPAWLAQFKSPLWRWNDTTNIRVVDASEVEGGTVPEGGQALEVVYPEGYGGAGGGITELSRYPWDELWIRFYARYSTNFKDSRFNLSGPLDLGLVDRDGDGVPPDGGAADAGGFVTVSGTLRAMTFHWGDDPPYISVGAPETPRFRGDEFEPPTGSLSPFDGRWHCFEVHYRVGALGVGDVEGFIDGTQTIAFYDDQVWGYSPPFDVIEARIEASWRCYTSAPGNGCGPGGNCACHEPTRMMPHPDNLHPEMRRWTDAYVLGTQRIGCLAERTEGAMR